MNVDTSRPTAHGSGVIYGSAYQLRPAALSFEMYGYVFNSSWQDVPIAVTRSSALVRHISDLY